MRTMPMLLATLALMACSQREDAAARDSGESGAAADTVGPPGDSLRHDALVRDSLARDSSTGRSDTTPAATRPRGDDTSRYKRPERRPIRDIPPLTKPDTTTPP